MTAQRTLFGLAVALALASGAARAQSVSTRNPGQAADTDELPVGFQASLSHYVGQGTFVVGPAGNPYVLSDLTLSTSLRAGPFTFALTEEAFLEWTDSDVTTRRLQPQMFDLGASAKLTLVELELFDLHVDARALGALPLSLESRAAGILGSGGFGLGGGLTVPLVEVSVSTQAQLVANVIVPALIARYELEPAMPYVDRQKGPLVPAHCLARTPRELTAYACGTVPTLATTVATVAASRSFFDGAWSIDASLAAFVFVSSFFGPEDEFTSSYAFIGRGLDPYTSGTLSTSLTPLSWLTLTVGTWSFQSLTTDDGRFLRFPFWDVLGPAENRSTLFFSTTLTL